MHLICTRDAGQGKAMVMCCGVHPVSYMIGMGSSGFENVAGNATVRGGGSGVAVANFVLPEKL